MHTCGNSMQNFTRYYCKILQMSDSPDISQSSISQEELYKIELKKCISKGHKRFPKITADITARHVSNIIQEGNPNDVCIDSTIWQLLYTIHKTIRANRSLNVKSL